MLTTMDGGATGGYCATGNCVMATPPRTRMNSAITHAKMGRVMKNWAMVYALYLAGADAALAAGEGAGAGEGALPVQGTGWTGAPGTIIF